jgi:hypothetical protein
VRRLAGPELIAGSDHNDDALIAAARIVNAIPAIVGAAPGIAPLTTRTTDARRS